MMKSKFCIWTTTFVCVTLLLLNSPSALADTTQSNTNSSLNETIEQISLNSEVVPAMIGIWTILGILVLVVGSVAIYQLYKTAKTNLYPPPPTNNVPDISMTAFIPSDLSRPMFEGNSLDIEQSNSESVTDSESPFGVEVVIDRSGASPRVELAVHKFVDGELKTDEEIKQIILSYGLNPQQGINYLVGGQRVDVGNSPIYKLGNVVVVENATSSVTNNFTLEVSSDLENWSPVIDISSQYPTNRIYGLEPRSTMFFRAVLH